MPGFEHSPGVPAFVLLAVATPNGAASIDFTGIPAEFFALKVVYNLQSDRGVASVNTLLRFNGDTGANYERVFIKNLSANGNSGQTSIQIGECVNGPGLTNATDSGEITIPNYTSALKKAIYGHSTFRPSVNNEWNYQVSGWWDSTAAINQVTILPDAANWAVGSKACLYGIR